jgi:hypothetical protein
MNAISAALIHALIIQRLPLYANSQTNTQQAGDESVPCAPVAHTYVSI